MPYWNSPPKFPSVLPDGYQYFDEEVEFDPDRHLQLEPPQDTVRLSDLGYDAETIKKCPTDLAISGAIRLLSDEGVKVMRDTARSLRKYAVNCERIENMVRGGVYQSRFLRDFCLCGEVTEFISDIFGTQVSPHTMPLHLGHLNYAPDDLTKPIDKWHHDTLSLDYVLLLSDPGQLFGGEFQYFRGTREQAKEISDKGDSIPSERIVSPRFPGAGYAFVLHGYMVVHRGARLTRPGERITLVNGYVPLNTEIDDVCRFPDLSLVDPHHVLFAEWARHKAWLSMGRLQTLVDEIPFTDDKRVITNYLRDAIHDVETAISDINDTDNASMIYYGD